MLFERLIRRFFVFALTVMFMVALEAQAEFQSPGEWGPANGVSIGHRQGPLRNVNPPVKLANGDWVTVSTVNESWTNGTVVLLKYGKDLSVKGHHTVEFENIRTGLAYPRIYKLEQDTILVAGIFKEHVFAEPLLWLGFFDSDLQQNRVVHLRIQPEDVDYFYPRWLQMRKLASGYRFFVQSSQQGPYEGLVTLETNESFEVQRRGWFTDVGARFFPLQNHLGEGGAFSVVALPGYYHGGHRIPSFRRYWFDADFRLVKRVEANDNLGSISQVSELSNGSLRLLGNEIYSSPVDGRLRSRMSQVHVNSHGQLLQKLTVDDFDKDWRYVSMKKKIVFENGDVAWIASGQRSSNEDPRVLLLLKNSQGETLQSCVRGEGTGIYLSSAKLIEDNKLHIMGNRDRSRVWIAELNPYQCGRDSPRQIELD